MIPTAGQLALQRVILENATLHLFANDLRPGPADTIVDYDEPTGGGYEPHAVDDPLFVFPGPVGAVYGYFLVRDGIVIYADRFADGPYEVNNPGDQIAVNVGLRVDG